MVNGHAYRIASKPHAFDGISQDTQSGPSKLLRNADVTLHIYESDGQQRAVFLQTANHALLPVRRKQEALGAYLGDRSHGSFVPVSPQSLELPAGLGMLGLGHHGDDVQNVHGALGADVFSPRNCRSDCDHAAPSVRRLGRFHRQVLHAHHLLVVVQGKDVCFGPCRRVDQADDILVDLREEICAFGVPFGMELVVRELEVYFAAGCDHEAIGWLVVFEGFDSARGIQTLDSPSGRKVCIEG